MTQDALPILALKGPATSQAAGATTALGAMLGAATARAAQASVLSGLVAEDLLRHLHLKLHACGVARRRHCHVLGKISNVIMGNDPDYIDLTGRHVAQTMTLLGVDAQTDLDVTQVYVLRADVARQAHDLLGAQLDVDPDTLRQGL